MDAADIQPKIQVLAKFVLRRKRVQIAVGRGYKPDIQLNRLSPTEPLDLFFLNRSQ